MNRLSNGLIRRDFVTEPNFGTLDFYSIEDDSSILRAFTPEAMVEIYIEDRKLNLSVGGVTSNIPRGYLNRFIGITKMIFFSHHLYLEFY